MPLYIEEDKVKLSSIVTASQFIINDKLLTLLGEHHLSSFNCSDNSIGVLEYIRTTLNSTPSTRVLLEYWKPDGKYYTKVASNNMQIILKNLKDDKIKNIKAVDYRDLYFDSYTLYGVENTNAYSYKYIQKKFIDTYYKNRSKFKNDFITHDCTNCKYTENFLKFVDVYIDKLDKKMQKIVKMQKQKNHKIEKLKKLWVMINDIFIIREFFRIDDKNDIIVLVGNVHYYNICKILDEFNVKYITKKTNEDEDPEKCVEIKLFKRIKEKEN